MTSLILGATVANLLKPGEDVGSVEGALSGVTVDGHSSFNLTTLGGLDWAHWGWNTASEYEGNYMNHKSDGGSGSVGLISDVSGGSTNPGSSSFGTFTWTDGYPKDAKTNITYLVYRNAQSQTFVFTAPADTTSRTLDFLWGIQENDAAQHVVDVTVSLSDASAADYTTQLDVSGGASSNPRRTTVTYNAASAGQTLTVTITYTTRGGGGYMFLQGAWLNLAA